MASRTIRVGWAVICKIDEMLVEIVSPFKDEFAAQEFSDELNDVAGPGTRWELRSVTRPEDIVILGKEIMDPERSPILEYFAYEHLPQDLQEVSRVFCELAHWVEDTLPKGPEKSTALRKLLEGKDAAVRSALGFRV